MAEGAEKAKPQDGEGTKEKGPKFIRIPSELKKEKELVDRVKAYNDAIASLDKVEQDKKEEALKKAQEELKNVTQEVEKVRKAADDTKKQIVAALTAEIAAQDAGLKKELEGLKKQIEESTKTPPAPPAAPAAPLETPPEEPAGDEPPAEEQPASGNGASASGSDYPAVIPTPAAALQKTAGDLKAAGDAIGAMKGEKYGFRKRLTGWRPVQDMGNRFDNMFNSVSKGLFGKKEGDKQTGLGTGFAKWFDGMKLGDRLNRAFGPKNPKNKK